MDLLFGLQALAYGTAEKNITAGLSLHVNEVALLQYAGKDSGTYFTKSRF
ncbi:MAG: hypothetical protein ACI9C9_002855 [Marivirga sp.]|jgi:hypothetical protein